MDVSEVLKIGKDRKKRRKVLINELLENIHKRIKYHAVHGRVFCEYQVPGMISGLPLFNIQEVAVEVYKKLDEEGFLATVYNNGLIYICWDKKQLKSKASMDSFLVRENENKIKNLTKKSKNVDERCQFIANPRKTKEKPKPSDLDIHVNKILKERENQKKKYKGLIDNY